VADSFLRSLAIWALLHEMADDGWKAAVARGAAGSLSTADGGSEAFVDALAALVSEEKERLKTEWAGVAGFAADEPRLGADAASSPRDDLAELRFELAEVRGRLEAIETALDTLLRRTEPTVSA
jgi:hypothetical protein